MGNGNQEIRKDRGMFTMSTDCFKITMSYELRNVPGVQKEKNNFMNTTI